MTIALRDATPADAEACGRIIYAAFRDIALRHGFPPDFPSVEAGVRTARYSIEHPQAVSLVAQREDVVAGSAFMNRRDPIYGIGPVSVDPGVQDGGVGRLLMRGLLDRASGAAGVRLVQDAFNTVSLPLYASLGFDVCEPLVLIAGVPRSGPPPGIAVRRLTPEDISACAELCTRVHGFARTAELQDTLARFAPIVAERQGRITAYSSAVLMRGHGVAETDDDLAALIAGAAAFAAEPPALLLPTRQAGLFRWCLRAGMRVIKPNTLMTIGTYQEPMGSWFPSILY